MGLSWKNLCCIVCGQPVRKVQLGTLCQNPHCGQYRLDKPLPRLDDDDWPFSSDLDCWLVGEDEDLGPTALSELE